MENMLEQSGRRFLDTDGEAKPGLGHNVPYSKPQDHCNILFLKK